MLKIREGEEYKIKEFQDVEEFQYFDAEDFKSLEHIRMNMEELESEEIKAVSFCDDKNKEIPVSRKKDDAIIKKVIRSTSSAASTTGTVATSLGTAGVLLVAGVAGAGMVMTEVLNPTPIIEVLNYTVDYDYNDKSEITIQLGDLKEKYSYFAKRLGTNEKIEIDYKFKQFEFSDLELGSYDIEIVALDELEKEVKSEVVKIDTNYVVPMLEDVDFEHLVSFNHDTSNLYMASDIPKKLSNYNVETKLEVYDENDLLNIYTSASNGVIKAENINNNKYQAQTKAYVKKDNNYYMVSKSEMIEIDTNDFGYLYNLTNDKLTLSFLEKTKTDINVEITYLDDLSKEEFTITQNETEEDIVVQLKRVVDKINLKMSGIVNYPYKNNLIKTYKGSLTKQINTNKDIAVYKTSYMKLNRMEFLDSTFDYEASNNVNYIYIDGFLDEDSYINLIVKDENNQEVSRKENVKDLSKPIAIYDLENGINYTFNIELYKNETLVNEENYISSIDKPIELENLDVTFYGLNPGDVTLTYNDDGTYNAYFNTGFANKSEIEDIFYCINLTSYDLDTGETVINYSLQSNHPTGVIENIDPSISYSLNYYTLGKIGQNYYSLSSKTVPSGTLDYPLEDGMIKNGYISIYEQEPGTKLYDISIPGEVGSDVDVVISLDGQEPIYITIPKLDIIDESSRSMMFTLDLKEYDFVSFDITIEGQGNMRVGDFNFFRSIENIKGNKYVKFILSETYYGG